MRTLFFIPIVLLSSVFVNPQKTDAFTYDFTNQKLTKDSLISSDSILVTLNVYYDEIPPYFNFEGDTTKRNIFNVRYYDTDLEIYHIVDYKKDFWTINDSNVMKIIDTIEFYEYPPRN